MFEGVWTRLTTPKTSYERGRLRNEQQADAACKVDRLESFVRGVASEMNSIDETPGDANFGVPGSVYGSVNVGSRYTGACELAPDGRVVSMNVTSGGGTRVTVETHGNATVIHQVDKRDGWYLSGPPVLEQHQVAFIHGSQVGFKEYEFWSNDMS